MERIDQLYEIYKSTNGVEIDSRKVTENQMFFAFKGEHTDGHKYVADLIRRPGCYAVVDDQNYDFNDRTILVGDTLLALQQLARLHRNQFSAPVFALTGSNGKTTTKELIMSILSIDYNIHATSGNYNNHIGVPLTLLAAKPEAEILIIEMGANRLNDIKELCDIANPDMGMITNIGNAHVGTFGSEGNILIGKTELYDHISNRGGMLFVNKYDEKLISRLPENIELVLYPMEEIDFESKDMFLILKDKLTSKSYKTQLTGLYNISNIQAALSVGSYFGVDRHKALSAIANYEPRMNRSQIKDIGSTRIIMDAYNANPTSMEASIKSVLEQSGDRDKILVLGDMLELGDNEVAFHRQVIDLINDYPWKKVMLVGPIFKKAKANSEYLHFDDIEQLKQSVQLDKNTFENSLILLKASRSMQLEKFIELFED